MASPCPVLHTLADHAAALAALPAGGPLPVRTAVVSSERHAHALRRELLRSGRPELLAGTRFVGAATLAREILEDAGVAFAAGEEALRPARLLALLGEDLGLEYFALDLLRSTPGWPEAFAAAVADLEGAGLEPASLPAADPRWRDVRLVWTRLDAAAGRSWTSARILREAAARLRAGDGFAGGPAFAAVTGREPAVLAAFLAALPGAALGVVAARPLRTRHLERVEALYGPEARRALEEAPPPAAAATERDLLARFLFAPPERLADAARPRSRGPDGTVSLEAHSGVEAEVEAAAEWVAREVLERRTPLEEVAILVPGSDALAPWVASRLSRLPWTGAPFPVHVAGGLPLASSAGGARALAIVRALRAFLPAEAVAEVLPSLRAPRPARTDDAAPEPRLHLAAGEAVAVAWGTGTVGGGAARREGALEWPGALAAREAQLAARIEALDPAGEEREGWRLRDELEVLRAARPAVDALAAVARLAVEGRPLAELAPALADLLERWMLDPSAGAPVHALLRDDLASARADAVAGAVRGPDALAAIEDRLLALRLSTARFGSPAVHVGTLAGAAGLEFTAVRVLGLAEGALPSAVREDAILPDRLRAQAGPLVPLSADRVDAQLHAFDRAVRGARARLALSVPHSDLERSDREASSLVVEVGAALGRPGGEGAAAIPDLASLRTTSFEPARAEAAAFRAAHPLTGAQWLDRAADTGEVPPSWREAGALDLPRILGLRGREGLGAADGILGSRGPFPPFPGLVPERPISASALGDLVACPLRFLQGRVLGREEAAGPPPVRELDALAYGSLLHEVAERFYRAQGGAFAAHQGTLARWKERARALAREAFAALRVSRPLVGRGVEEKERNRLLRDLDALLAYDWGRPLDRFVGVEVPFDGLALDAGGGKLHVRGYIDRLDVEQGHALVRDLKTGRDHPRDGDEAGPTPARDVQLGLYGLVARARAREWGLPRRVQAAYVYPRSGTERAFREDWAELEAATRGWLAVARGLLAGNAFPPSPSEADCRFCPFLPACDGQPRAAAARDGAEGPVARFFATKPGEEEEP